MQSAQSDLKFHRSFKERCRFIERKGVVLEELKAALYDYKERLNEQLIQEVDICLPFVRVFVASKQRQVFLDHKNTFISFLPIPCN